MRFLSSGLLIGPRGATQKQMQEATGAKIVFRGIGASKDGGPSNTGHEDDTDKLHVSIEGPPDAVERALHQVEQILYNPAEASRLKAEQLKNLAGINNVMSVVENIYGPGGGSGDQTSVEIRIPNNMVGLVIGKGGESILRIQSQLGVNAQIDKECPPGENYRRIVLKGKPSAVDEARARIDDIINARVSMGGNSSNNHKEMDYAFVVRLPVPNDKVGIIIGKGGMTVKGIQERCYVNVQIPAGPDDDNPQVRTLSIGADTKEAVDAAQMEIFMTLQQQQQSALQAYNSSGSITNVVVPDDKVGLIIGKGGLTVKDIQNRYQVKIQIPQVADAGSYPPVRTLR